MLTIPRTLAGVYAALAVLLAACGDYAGGYDKVMFRERPTVLLAAAPNPPPVVAGIGGGAVAAPVLPPELAPPGVTQEMVEEGQRLFGTVCAACHGAGGSGSAAAPPLGDQDWINIGGSYDEIIAVIQSGVSAPRSFPAPMPPMGGGNFTPDQVRAIGAYIFALSRPPA